METDRERYERLSMAWFEETQFQSWADHILNSPSALLLRAEGKLFLPWMIEDMRAGIRLDAILPMISLILRGGPHIPEEDRGRIYKTQKHWIEWFEWLEELARTP